MSDSECNPVTLAENPIARVQHCAHCGCVSLSVGPATLRMDATALEALWLVIGDAAHALHVRQLKEPHLRVVR